MDLDGPCNCKLGTMGDHMITIYLNRGTGGPSYMDDFVEGMFL